jgi:heme/copper-type cytochrome/quinol oxidase subunit 2
MAVDQLTSNILVALTLILAIVLVRAVIFARLNSKLRRALRDRPEDVPALIGRMHYRPLIYDLWSWAVITLAVGLATLSSQASADDRRAMLEMAIVTGVSGLVLLAYIRFQRRASERRLEG